MQMARGDPAFLKWSTGRGAAPPKHQRPGDLSSPPGVHRRRKKKICVQVLASPEQGFGVPSGCLCHSVTPIPEGPRLGRWPQLHQGRPEISRRSGLAARPSTHPIPESDEGGSEKYYGHKACLGKVCRPQKSRRLKALPGPRSPPTSLTPRTPEGTSRAPRFGRPVPRARPAAPLPRGLLHLARSPPRSAARAWPGLAHVHPCCPGPLSGPAPSSLRAARAGVPAPRSRRGPAAPDSRRQGPSPSRPKAEEKGAEKASPALARRAPHEPSAAGVGGTAAAGAR
eukprot:bmy_01472T0